MMSILTKNKSLLAFVEDAVKLCKPAKVHWCDGSEEEYKHLCDTLVKHGTFTKLNEKLRPGSYLARSHASDVARVEDRTYICCSKQEDAGPTNNWADPVEMKEKIKGLFKGCKIGRAHV